MNDSVCAERFKANMWKINANYINRSQWLYYNNPSVWKNLDYVDGIKISAYIIIIIGGLLGNIIVILTVAFKKSMWTTINFYVANVAVADAMISLICMVPHFLDVLTDNLFILGAFMCKFYPFTQMICMTSSVLTLSAVSWDQFMAVMFPFRSRITKQRISMVTKIIWIISIAVSVPFLIVNRHRIVEWKDFVELQCFEAWPSQPYYDESLEKCLQHKQLLVLYYVSASLIFFFLPILIMIAAYSLIFKRLRTAKECMELSADAVSFHTGVEKKVIKMCFVVLIVFTICWTPFQVMVLYFAFRQKGQPLPKWVPVFHWFSHYLAYAKSFMNPIVYSGFNKGIREVFYNVLQCGYGRDTYGSTVRRKIFTISGSWNLPRSTVETLNGTTKFTFQMSSMKMKLIYPITDIDTSSTTIEKYFSTAEKEVGAFL